MKFTPIATTTVLAAAGGIAFTSVVRPWYHRWGASDEEVMRPMPLDERIPGPTMQTTMAITINARPEAIWPWLVQIGDPPRAGYYSYTWIEKAVGLDIQNAGRILPRFQSVTVGQALDGNGTMVVQAVEPGKSLVLGPPDSIDYLKCTWAFGLYPIDARSTRLVTRVRARWSYRQTLCTTPPWAWPMWLLIDPGAFIMERKMLKEIKGLAEAHSPILQSGVVITEPAMARMETDAAVDAVVPG
ncbi:MAG TPA: hypothetical protein VFI12_01160 [Thermomicrobiales bacterium]|nr:hypothetical protein [Thermomicrobiales bacterium]